MINNIEYRWQLVSIRDFDDKNNNFEFGLGRLYYSNIDKIW